MDKSWGLEVQACEDQQEGKLSAKLSRCDFDNHKRKEPIRMCVRAHPDYHLVRIDNVCSYEGMLMLIDDRFSY